MTAVVLAALAVGYAVGRFQPAHRLSDWAAWQFAGLSRPTGLRRATAQTVSVVDFLLMQAWDLVCHPCRFIRAWKNPTVN